MNEAHVRKKCLTYGLVGFDICLSKGRHYISTVIILYKQNVLCARMVGAPVEEKGLGPWCSAPPPPLAPERDATGSKFCLCFEEYFNRDNKTMSTIIVAMRKSVLRRKKNLKKFKLHIYITFCLICQLISVIILSEGD